MIGFSLVVTCYNLEKYIEEALRSVFEQDYTGPWEVIIVDDASQDNSVAVIEESIRKYGKGRDITFLKNKQNTGVSGATDKAWNLAKYEWIIEIDGDDVQYPDRCTKTAQLIEQYPDAGAVFLSFSCINSKGEGNYRSFMVRGEPDASFCAHSPKLRADIFSGKAIDSPACKGAYGCSFAISKKVINHWGPLNDELIKCYAQDPPWELRAFLSFPVVWSNQLACKYRSHDSNILNKTRSYDSVSDCVENELSMCAYDRKELQALNRMLADLTQVLNGNKISDWQEEDITYCTQVLQQYKLARTIRADWWTYNTFKKIYLILKTKNKVPTVFTKCFLTRLMPLKLYAWCKMKKMTRKK